MNWWNTHPTQVHWTEVELKSNQETVVPYPETKSPPKGGWLIEIPYCKFLKPSISEPGSEWCPPTAFLKEAIVGYWTFRSDGLHLIGPAIGRDIWVRIALTPLW